jgi:hypothetical protein
VLSIGLAFCPVCQQYSLDSRIASDVDEEDCRPSTQTEAEPVMQDTATAV